MRLIEIDGEQYVDTRTRRFSCGIHAMSYNRHYPFTEEKLARWIAEGRGTGRGASYLPWLTAADLPPKQGHKYRSFCSVANRMAISLSTTEAHMRWSYEAAEGTEDLQEQFPLDREVTRAIARELGIVHPRDPESGVDIVMTTDLVVTCRSSNGSKIVLPRSAKYDKNMGDFNQAEHGEIERRYWLRKNREWKFVTNSKHCMPKVLVANLTLMHQWRFPPEIQPFDGYFERLCERLIAAVVNYSGPATVSTFGAQFQAKHGLAAGEAINALLHLIFRHRLRADLAAGPLMDQRVEAIAAATIARGSARNRKSA